MTYRNPIIIEIFRHPLRWLCKTYVVFKFDIARLKGINIRIVISISIKWSIILSILR